VQRLVANEIEILKVVLHPVRCRRRHIKQMGTQ